MNHLSVYQRRQRGGSLKTTLLKKGEGNLQALREDVAQALGLTHKEVKVNNVTKHIEVKVLRPVTYA
jgi:large subunit ribosomal protein L49